MCTFCEQAKRIKQAALNAEHHDYHYRGEVIDSYHCKEMKLNYSPNSDCFYIHIGNDELKIFYCPKCRKCLNEY